MALKKGTAGNDTISGTTAADDIYGYAGNDHLTGNSGNDRIWGGDGGDRVLADAGNDQVWGDGGNDTLSGGSGNDIMWGGSGRDTIYGDAGTDEIHGGSEDDIIYGGLEFDVLYGDAGNDTFYTSGWDDVFGGDGNDTIYGGGGTVHGDAGNDTIYIGDFGSGDAGNDTFIFELGRDAGSNDQGMSFSNGGIGFDTFRFINNSDNPYMITQISPYFAGFSDPRDAADGLPSGTMGNLQNFERYEAVGNHALHYNGIGTDADIQVAGDTKNDIFLGGAGDETLEGRAGNDVFDGGEGINVYIGGTGADEFRLGPDDGLSYVRGFEGAGVTGGDRIVIDRWDGAVTAPNAYTTNIVQTTAGHTLIQLADDGVVLATLDIDKVGLKFGDDYLFV